MIPSDKDLPKQPSDSRKFNPQAAQSCCKEKDGCGGFKFRIWVRPEIIRWRAEQTIPFVGLNDLGYTELKSIIVEEEMRLTSEMFKLSCKEFVEKLREETLDFDLHCTTNPYDFSRCSRCGD